MRLGRIFCYALLVVIYTVCMVIYIQTDMMKGSGRYKPFPGKLIILVSQPRSGSTFLGNVISKSIKSIYFYEPLYQLDNNVKIDINLATHQQRKQYDVIAAEYLKHVFNCDFTERNDLQKVLKSPFKSLGTLAGNECDERDDRLKYKHPVKSTGDKSYMLNRCVPFLNANHLQKQCQIMNLMVKLLELRVPYSNVLNLKSLISNKIRYKLIYLVRDPRAAFLSLLKTGWVAKSIDDVNFKKYILLRCNEMTLNLKEVAGKNDIVIVRYEDLIAKPRLALKDLYEYMPKKEGEDILKSLERTSCYVPKFNNPSNISLYPKRTLKGFNDDDDDDSGQENESQNDIPEDEINFDTFEQRHRENYECYAINKWRYVVTVNFVKIVENSCSEFMSILGYKQTNGDSDMIKDITCSLVEPKFKTV